MPFVTPFRTAHGQTTHREGLILSIVADDGQIGLGEAAPLGEFGGGDVERAVRLLQSVSPELVGIQTDDAERRLASLLPDRADNSAVRFALETALLDLEGQRRGVRLANLLAQRAVDSVPINATIGQADDAVAAQAARAAVTSGFRTVKLKVGISASTNAEVARVAAVREAMGPEARLRLDANGAWTVAQAIEVIGTLAQFGIELVEQPVAPAEVLGLAEVRRAVCVPVAADEAVTSIDSARGVIDADAADVLVIKPMVCGGLRVARQIIELADSAGLRCIVTSSLECGVGVAPSLHLAATLPPDSPACGLATLDLLEDDLILERLDVVDGRMRLPTGPGLGVRLDEDALERYVVNETPNRS